MVCYHYVLFKVCVVFIRAYIYIYYVVFATMVLVASAHVEHRVSFAHVLVVREGVFVACVLIGVRVFYIHDSRLCSSMAIGCQCGVGGVSR